MSTKMTHQILCDVHLAQGDARKAAVWSEFVVADGRVQQVDLCAEHRDERYGVAAGEQQ